jgi:small-conductance mechanosensitive channel/CRP-like cAMP-binding protein
MYRHYKRFVTLAISIVLLLGTMIIFILGHNQDVTLFYTIQKELLAVSVFLFCYVFIQLCDLIIWNGLFVKNGRPIFPKILVRFINFLIFVIALFIVLQWIYNINVTQLLVASSLLALILAYGTQSNLANIFSGITLNMTHDLEIGDWIEVEISSGVFISGQVESLDWRCVTLKNFEENLVVVPNSVLAEKVFINYSKPSIPYKQQFYIKISYTIRPEEVITYFKKAMSENEKICLDKPINAYLSAFEGDSAIYHILFFSEKYVNADIKDEILRSVYYQVLRTHHSAAPFVTFSLIKHPSDAVRIDREKIVHLISSQSVLSCLQAEELNELINNADFERFSTDETLLHQGIANTGIYILLKGGLQIEHQQSDGSKVILEQVHDFAVIGEYSMLLDELPQQTVRCTEESLVMIIRRDAFRRIVLQRTEIIDSLKNIIENRQSENARTLEKYRREKAHQLKPVSGSILERLKAIFNADR